MPTLANIYQDPFGAPEAEAYELPTKEGARKNRKDFVRGLQYMPQDLLGAPVDLTNMLLWGVDQGFGTQLSSEKPVGGSDWLIDQSRRLAPNMVQERTGSGWELGGRLIGGLVNPAGVVRGAVKAPRALADIAEMGSVAATRKITGNPNIEIGDIYRAMSEQQRPVSSIMKEKGGQWLGKEDFAQGLRQEQDRIELQDLWDLNANEVQKSEQFRMQEAIVADDPDIYGLRTRLHDLARDRVDPSQEFIDIVKKVRPDIKDERARLQLAANLEYDAIQKQLKNIEDNAWRDSSNYISKQYGIPTIDELDQPRQIYNQWVEKPLTKYMTNNFGTVDDPLRKLADEGIDKWIDQRMLDEPPNQYVRQARQAQGYPPEGLGKTPLSRLFEDQADDYLRHGRTTPAEIKQADSEWHELYKQNPWINKLDEQTPLYALNEFPPQFAERLGKEVKILAQEGKIKPDQVAKWTPDSIARSAHERALADEALASKDLGAMHEWAKARKETIPTFMDFNNGDSIAIMSKDIDPETLKRDLSLQTCLLNHCVGSAGHDAGKYLPMVLPHTGKPPAKAKEGFGTRYYRDILEGDTEIHSLLDRDGLPKVTMEWKVVDDGEGFKSYEIHQIYGEENNAIKPEQKQKIIDYLNERKFDIVELGSEVMRINGIEEVTQPAITSALENWIKSHSSKGISKQQQIAEMGRHYSKGYSGNELETLSHSIFDDFYHGDYPRFYSEDESLIEKHIDKLFRGWWKENKKRYIESNI